MKIGMTKIIASLMLSTALLPVAVSKAASTGDKATNDTDTTAVATNQAVNGQNNYVQSGKAPAVTSQAATSTVAVSASATSSSQASSSQVDDASAANTTSTATAARSVTSQTIASSAASTSTPVSVASQAPIVSSAAVSQATVTTTSAATAVTSATSGVQNSAVTGEATEKAAPVADQALSAVDEKLAITSQESIKQPASATSIVDQMVTSAAPVQVKSVANSAAMAIEPEDITIGSAADEAVAPTMNDYQQTFFNQIKAGALEGWRKYGVLPSITAAQAIIESNWGRSALSTQGNNLFGIKGAYQGQSIYFETNEWVNGQYVTVRAAFRQYPNWSASVEDHGAFLVDNSRYHNLLGVTDYQTVARLLQSDGYATDPNYATALINTINSYQLQNWDQEVIGTTPEKPAENNTTGTYKFTKTVDIHTAASMQSAVVGTYDAGESVHYNGKVVADGYTWLRYQSYSGTTHYIAISGDDSVTVTPATGTFKFTTTTNIRDGASRSAKIVGTYDAGESVHYNGTIEAEGITWLRYQSYSGATHYVAIGDDVADAAPSVESATGAYRFTADTAIKSAPRATATTVGTYRTGETVYYNGKVTIAGQTWLRYRSYSGADHYVAINGNLNDSKPVVTATSGTYRFQATTAIKEAPAANATTVGTYYAGDTVRYNAKVTVNGQTWLRYQSYSGATHYVALDGNQNNLTTTTAKTGSFTFTTTTNIRTAPSTRASIAGEYYPGDRVYYSGTVVADGYTWLKYLSRSGATHYVAVVH
ncbi:cell wall hydrolase [Lactobacillus sp. CBA3605]|uniref:SH3 domain-containing protein n=1 Tax=Lactobacillus sp. CBA3605 TaxID=2099788 RepID=UPI000CFCFE61|nr:SH3 domain-containing protein [Lactobacillus sp. CBA3605]AVK60940.1 cell wall hydrolase [Lactobacillus sp. CBA3605]